MLCCCIQVAYSQQRGEEKVVFDFDCEKPKIKHEINSIVLPMPLAKDRTKVGSAEVIILSVQSTFDSVIWEKKSGLGKLVKNGSNMATFTAPLKAGKTVIRATPKTDCGLFDEITFEIIEPSKVIFTKQCGFHRTGFYEAGMKTYPNSLMLDNVSFENVCMEELDALCVATGGLSIFNGKSHGPSGTCHFANIVNFGSFNAVTITPNMGTILTLQGEDIAEWTLGSSSPSEPNGELKFEDCCHAKGSLRLFQSTFVI